VPIPSSILYPALINAAGDPALLDILVELSQDADVPPEAELSSDDPEYLAASRRIERRMKSHLGMHSDDELEEAINAVSTSGFTGINQQIPSPKHLEESRQQRFSTTQFLLPDELTQEILRLSNRIPDGVLMPPGREPTPHITVKYGLHGNDPEVIRQAVENYGPVSVKLGKTSVFPSKETQGGYDVVKVDVDSDDLHGLNRVICDAVPHADMHPDYQPHVTLGYVQPGAGGYYAGWNELDGKEVVLDELVFSNADKQATRIPLGEGRKNPTAKVDDTLAKLQAIRDGEVEASSEELQALLDGLGEEELVKVEAMFGGEIEPEVIAFVEALDGPQARENAQWLLEAAEDWKSDTGPRGGIYWYNTKTDPQAKFKHYGKRPPTGDGSKRGAKKTTPTKDDSPVAPAKSGKASKASKQSTQQKSSINDVAGHIEKIKQEGVTDQSVSDMIGMMKSMTVKEITAVKQKLGLKASGKKEELIHKIAQRAIEGARKVQEEKPAEEPKQEVPKTDKQHEDYGDEDVVLKDDDEAIVLDDDSIVLPDDDDIEKAKGSNIGGLTDFIKSETRDDGEDIVLPDDDDLEAGHSDSELSDQISLDDDPEIETVTPAKPDKPKKIMADTILEDKVIRETVQQLSQLFDDESDQYQKNQSEQINKQRKQLSPQYQSFTLDQLNVLLGELSEKLGRGGLPDKEMQESFRNYNAITQIAVLSSPVMKYKPDQKKTVEKLTSVLSKNVTSPMKFQLGKPGPKVSRKAADVANNAIGILGSIVQMRSDSAGIDIGLANTEPRAHYASDKKHINVGSNFHLGVAIHEMAHAIEIENPSVLKACLAFLEHRVIDEKAVSLNKQFPGNGFREDEFGRKDNFDAVFGEESAYYVGKSYGESATEVLSMGLEHLFRDPVNFAKKDPEYAGFLVGVLNGSITGDILYGDNDDDNT